MTEATTPMAGKSVLITGSTGGIGKATAIGLAGMGSRVAITGRDHDRVQAAVAEIRDTTGNPDVEGFVADLSSQAEVRRLAADILEAYPRLDVLVNNVGGFWATRHVTADRLERTFAVNHLAGFLLTNLLLDRLRSSAPSRVVTVSSAAHAMGAIDFDDLQGEHGYSGQQAYNQSKLANVLFTYELARRVAGSGVTANALHPGVVDTGFGAEDPSTDLPVPRAAGATVHEDAGTRRSHLDLPGIVARGRGHHRPVLRRSQSPNLEQGLLRRGGCGAPVADEWRSRRRRRVGMTPAA